MLPPSLAGEGWGAGSVAVVSVALLLALDACGGAELPSDAAVSEDANDRSDASVDPDAFDPLRVGACLVADRFSFSPGGTPVYSEFLADGAWMSAARAEDLGTAFAVPEGRWSLVADTISLTEPDPRSGCASDSTGVFRVSFTDDCARMSWTTIDDPCTRRASLFTSAAWQRL